MRYTLSLAVLGFVLGAAMPAFAQQQQQQQPSYVYGGQQQNAAPVYNNLGVYQGNSGSYYNSGANLTLLPMQQMVAGQNAPSYTYGNNRQQNSLYGNNGGFLSGNTIGGISPDQARAIRAQRDANAQAYQQQYMQDQQRQQQMNDPYAKQNQAGSQYQGAQFSQLYAENAEQKPVKRKVIYNQLNNPLVAPPRLFNVDR